MRRRARLEYSLGARQRAESSARRVVRATAREARRHQAARPAAVRRDNRGFRAPVFRRVRAMMQRGGGCPNWRIAIVGEGIVVRIAGS
eukprot:208646-Pleurochrysis_carterae.AAC.2